MNNIGEKIKSLRIYQGLTQEELAISAGTTKQTIHKYETGIISNIPASKIKLISDRLNTTPAYLMGWVDEGEKKNDIISDIILRLRSDDRFREIIDNLCKLSDEQLAVIETMLSAFKQQNMD